MPKSKRDRQVTLSKVQKKGGMEYKNSQIQIIRKEIPNYKNFFTFSTDNTGLWRDRFFFGTHAHSCAWSKIVLLQFSTMH